MSYFKYLVLSLLTTPFLGVSVPIDVILKDFNSFSTNENVSYEDFTKKIESLVGISNENGSIFFRRPQGGSIKVTEDNYKDYSKKDIRIFFLSKKEHYNKSGFVWLFGFISIASLGFNLYQYQGLSIVNSASDENQEVIDQGEEE